MNKDTRKINVKRYPTKWKDLLIECNNDIEQATIKYKRFCRSFCLEKYIILYGEEEGNKRFYEKKSNIKRGMSLENSIFRHGEKKGREVYEKWKAGIRQDKKSFIKRHGEEEGVKRFEIFREKSLKALEGCKHPDESYSTKIEYWLKKTNGDTEEAEKLLKKRQQTSTLENFVRIYGEKEGKKRYQENNKKKSLSLEWYTKRYGEEEGKEKYESHIEKLKFAHSLKGYIKRYGEEEGVRKYDKNCKRLFEIARKGNGSNRSIIGDNFCEFLYQHTKGLYEEIFFGENEFIFEVNNNDICKIIQPDFYIKDINMVIEFFGDYWHRNPKFFYDEESEKIRARDMTRLHLLKEYYDCNFVIVWENDYKNNPEKIIDDILGKINKREKCDDRTEN